MFFAHTIGGDTWGDWCDSTTTTTASNTTGVIWTTWASTGTATTSTNTATSSIYRIWVTQSSTAWTQSGNAGQVRTYRQTPQEAVEARRREEEYRERQKAEAERYRLAKDRAEGLLYEHLTDEQRAQIKRDKFFVVKGGKTGRTYRINAGGGISANVQEIDEVGKVKRRLCAYIEHAANAPTFDHFLAQKLMLEHAEEAYLKLAIPHAA